MRTAGARSSHSHSLTHLRRDDDDLLSGRRHCHHRARRKGVENDPREWPNMKRRRGIPGRLVNGRLPGYFTTAPTGSCRPKEWVRTLRSARDLNRGLVLRREPSFGAVIYVRIGARRWRGVRGGSRIRWVLGSLVSNAANYGQTGEWTVSPRWWRAGSSAIDAAAPTWRGATA